MQRVRILLLDLAVHVIAVIREMACYVHLLIMMQMMMDYLMI
jgi:hypothetical protein